MGSRKKADGATLYNHKLTLSKVMSLNVISNVISMFYSVTLTFMHLIIFLEVANEYEFPKNTKLLNVSVIQSKVILEIQGLEKYTICHLLLSESRNIYWLQTIVQLRKQKKSYTVKSQVITCLV